MKRSLSSHGLFVVLSILSNVGISAAQDPLLSYGDRPPPPPQMAAGASRAGVSSVLPEGLFLLDLTSEQEDAIAAIVETYSTDSETLRDEAVVAEKVLDDAVNTDDLDETAVREAWASLSVVKEEMMVLKAIVASQVRSLLSDAQKAKLDEFRALRWTVRERVSALADRDTDSDTETSS